MRGSRYLPLLVGLSLIGCSRSTDDTVFRAAEERPEVTAVQGDPNNVVSNAKQQTERSHQIEGGDHERPGNAALAYWQAFECLIDRSTDDSGYPDFLRIIRHGDTVPLDDAAEIAVRRAGLPLYFMHRASRSHECEWGLAFDEMGPRAEQGHNSHVTKLAGAAYLRARYRFGKQTPDKAIDDLLACLQLAEHTGRNGRDGVRTLLNQASIERKVIEITAGHLHAMDAECAARLRPVMKPILVRTVLRSFLQAQKEKWGVWPARFARHAGEHDNNWDHFWSEVELLGADSGMEVGQLVQGFVNGDPQQLTKYANAAADFFDEGILLTEGPVDQFRSDWTSLYQRASKQNPLIDWSGGEVLPALDIILQTDLQRSLFLEGLAIAYQKGDAAKVSDKGQSLFEYRATEHGFELISKQAIGGKRWKVSFVTRASGR